jgi:hypothetical protein
MAGHTMIGVRTTRMLKRLGAALAVALNANL